MTTTDPTTPLIQLMLLINGAANGDTAESIKEEEKIKTEDKSRPRTKQRTIPRGFAHNSEAHDIAQKFNLPLLELQITTREPEKNTLDLFTDLEAETYIPRYIVPEEIWQVFPLNLGGLTPQNVFIYTNNTNDENDTCGKALAWDKDQILFHCPRNAVCTMTRKEWCDGRRYCRMC